MSAGEILHVIPYMHPGAGGPPVVVDRICRGLAARGRPCRVITTDALDDGKDPSWRDPAGRGYALEVHDGHGPGAFGYSGPLARAIERAAAAAPLVHVHTVWTFPGLAAMKACRAGNVPFVVMPHGMLDAHSLGLKWVKKQVYGRVVEWPLVRAAAAMVYTHETERVLSEASVRDLPRGFVVPLGSDDPPEGGREALAEEFLASRPGLRGRPIVIFLSRLHPKKGPDLLLRAFASLDAPEARLLFVGAGDPEYVRTLEALAAKAGIGERVVFAGRLEGRAKWGALAAARVMALPSHQENFALVVVEAQRMGVPVVLSRRVNIWKEVVDGGGGAVCELDPASVAAALRPWLLDGAAARRAGEAGRDSVGAEFRWERCVERIDALYGEVLGARAAAGEGGA